jgi:S-formylglutathione hydrolase
MKFAVFLPKVESNEQVSILIWLSGLTCNEQNFITKSGFQKYAASHKIIVVAPDTSPSKLILNKYILFLFLFF